MTRLIAWLDRHHLLSLTHWNIELGRRGGTTARVAITAHRRMPERAVLAFAPIALWRVAGRPDGEPPALVLQSCSWSRSQEMGITPFAWERSTTHLTWDVVYEVSMRSDSPDVTP